MYLVFEIPNTTFKKVFGKVFKYRKITRYLVFYLNTNFWVFDTTLETKRFLFIQTNTCSSSIRKLPILYFAESVFKPLLNVFKQVTRVTLQLRKVRFVFSPVFKCHYVTAYTLSPCKL